MEHIYKLVDAFMREYPPADENEGNPVELSPVVVAAYFSPHLGNSFGLEAYSRILGNAGYISRFSPVTNELVWLAKTNVPLPDKKSP